MVKLFILSVIISAIFAIIRCDYKDVPDQRIFDLDKDIEKEAYEFNAGVNDEFYIKIHGNPTTGYSWYLSENSDKENLLALNLSDVDSSADYQVDPHPPGFVGIGGTFYFRFKGLKEGNYNLFFVKKRIWEKTNISERLVIINVIQQ